jgi:hypothetical protein
MVLSPFASRNTWGESVNMFRVCEDPNPWRSSESKFLSSLPLVSLDRIFSCIVCECQSKTWFPFPRTILILILVLPSSCLSNTFSWKESQTWMCQEWRETLPSMMPSRERYEGEKETIQTLIVIWLKTSLPCTVEEVTAKYPAWIYSSSTHMKEESCSG